MASMPKSVCAVCIGMMGGNIFLKMFFHLKSNAMAISSCVFLMNMAGVSE